MARGLSKDAVTAANFFHQTQGGHGYKSRHFYNPLTGEALSIRQVQEIRAGKYTVEQALLKQQTPLSSHIETSSLNGVKTKVTVFRQMSGAYNYATHSPNSSYFVVYGETKEPYEDDDGRVKSYRALSHLDSGRSIARHSLSDFWKKASDQVVIDGRTRYIVMERLP